MAWEGSLSLPPSPFSTAAPAHLLSILVPFSGTSVPSLHLPIWELVGLVLLASRAQPENGQFSALQDGVPREQVLRTGDEGMQAENCGFLAWAYLRAVIRTVAVVCAPFSFAQTQLFLGVSKFHAKYGVPFLFFVSKKFPITAIIFLSSSRSENYESRGIVGEPCARISGSRYLQGASRTSVGRDQRVVDQVRRSGCARRSA